MMQKIKSDSSGSSPPNDIPPTRGYTDTFEQASILPSLEPRALCDVGQVEFANNAVAQIHPNPKSFERFYVKDDQVVGTHERGYLVVHPNLSVVTLSMATNVSRIRIPIDVNVCVISADRSPIPNSRGISTD